MAYTIAEDDVMAAWQPIGAASYEEAAIDEYLDKHADDEAK